MKFAVKGIEVYRKSGKPKGTSRIEKIDTKNFLFAGLRTKSEIKRAYERYWNTNPHSTTMVKVLAVKEI